MGRVADSPLGVANLGRPVADDEDDFVSEFLKLAQLAESDDVAEVDVGSAGVEPHFEAEGFAFLEESDEFFLYDYFYHAAAEYAMKNVVA